MVEKTRAEQEDHEDPMLVDVDEPHQDHNDDIEVLDPNCERLLLERSRFAECGVISKIKLINFMCHENLEVNLSPHVNFIHGENGSGKSAILVAISTCLGVKASDTNRGSSLKELIKQGQEWGQVELTLTNKGSDAFDRQKYGNHITIRREITKTISTYKIMNDKGAIVGRTKKDLQGILDHFNIQVENPCVVMNQDTTKEFLLSNKNSSKYDFFLKATQLEQMGNIIDATTKDYDHANRYLGDAQKQLDILEKHFKEKEHLYNCTRDLAIIDQQIDELNDECLWAKVQEVGHDVDIKRSTTSEYTEKLQELHNQLSKLQIEKDAANKAYEDAKKALEAERHVINDDIRKRQDLGNSLQMAKKTVARFQAQLAQYEKNEQTAIKRCNDLQEQMRQLEAQRTRDRYQEDQERAEQIHKLKLRLVEQSEQVREAQIEAERCRHELDKCREAVKQNQNFLSDRRSYKRELDGELQSLERAASNHLNRFGRDMSALVHKIQLESRMFSTSPIGPIGAYVSMKDKRYSNAVQLAIGKKILCGFVVDSWADQKVLVKIFQNFYRNPWDIPKIIVLKKAASKYDIVPKNPLYGDYSRVVDVVDVSDPWCFNALVDMSQIDCSLLVPDASSAQLLLRKMEQRRERTPVVFTQHLERITLNKGSLNNSHLGGNRLNSILDSVTEADLDNRKRLAADVQAQINSIEAEGFELKRVVDRASDSSRLAAKKVQSQSSDLETTKADIANLEKQAAFDDDQVGSLIFSLHDKIAKCNQLIDDAKNDQLVCSENLVHAREDYELKLRDVEVFNENASKAGSSLEQATEQVNIAMKHVAEVQVKIEKIIPLQHTMERKVQGMMQEIDSVVEKLESIRQEALAQTSGRVLQSDRSSADILKEIYKLEEKKQADREAISSDSLEEITAAYIKAKEDFEAACLRVAESERDCIRIEKKLKSSSKDWDIFKKRLSKQASYDFQYNMSQKGHQGHIKFDHERGTLHMFVKMQHHQGENEMTSDTKALSGGERSFTTLAFVIAIGESIHTPFRALDEFDIFMDSVNRKIAINLLLELAKKYQNRQFIFITPQDVSMITTSPTTFVLMLKPPVRPAN